MNRFKLRCSRGAAALCVAALCVVALCVAAVGSSAAQEPTALQFAVHTEKLLVSAIASAEKSVVAIGRDGFRPERARVRVGPGGDLRPRPTRPNPEDLDYVHDEFATGVVVASNESRTLILTNYHVLGDLSDEDKLSRFYVTTADRKKYRATIHAADPRSDLALLRITARGLKPIAMGDASKLKKGRFVIALGNPYAIARDGQASASFGIVANIARKAGPLREETLQGKKPTLHHYGTLIQTDAKLSLGTSGGPLLNLRGEMIGLTTAAAALVGYEKSSGYAIPVNDTFRRVLASLKKRDEVKYGFLGISPANLRPERIRGGAQGILVEGVVFGTPAQRSGLMAGDVITHVDGQPVYESDGLIREISKRPVESVVTLSVLRLGEARRITVRLTKAPVEGRKIFNRPPSWRGVRVDYPTAVIRLTNSSLRGVGPCVAIVEVEQDSPAWQVGLRAGMLVTRVDNRPVDRPRSFRAALAGKSGAVTLRIADPQRSGPGRTITVRAG
ncbi:MAG: trypsin-like peptidase domain-containing protein [Planctomycetes bacterium]|nr:trypsin-like peptidase domain-containing protein [Planctomycetota bacterium]